MKPIYPGLCCPVCRGALQDTDDVTLHCTNASCAARYPVRGDIPILLNEANSLFTIDSYLAAQPTHFFKPQTPLRRAMARLLPEITANVRGKKNYRRVIELLAARTPTPTVLIVGGSVAGNGAEELLAQPNYTLVESDVSLGPRCTLICDSHDLPFVDGTFDAVIFQAVLEHVLDPARCVAEAYRVLQPKGLLYAETPFMQQVHGGAYDFTRFSHLGHRRLFRHFEEIDSGCICGSGAALAWSIKYFLWSWTANRHLRAFFSVATRLCWWWLKYIDFLTANTPGSYDAASGYYFLGKKSAHVLSDQELIKLYRGAL